MPPVLPMHLLKLIPVYHKFSKKTLAAKIIDRGKFALQCHYDKRFGS